VDFEEHGAFTFKIEEYVNKATNNAKFGKVLPPSSGSKNKSRKQSANSKQHSASYLAYYSSALRMGAW
jgi:hypothetical protein